MASNPIIKKALKKGFKSGGDIGDIGGGTGDVVSSSGGGRGGRGSGTRSEARRIGTQEAAKQAKSKGLKETAAQRLQEKERLEREKRIKEKRERAIKREQRKRATAILGNIQRVERKDNEVSYIGKNNKKVTFPKSRLSYSPEIDKEIRGGSSKIGIRRRLTQAAIKRENRERLKQFENRLISTGKKQFDLLSKKEIQTKEKIPIAPSDVRIRLLLKPITQTKIKISAPDLSFLAEENKFEKAGGTISENRGFFTEQLTEKDFKKDSLSNTYFGKTFLGKNIIKFGKGYGEFTYKPIKEFIDFYKDAGIATVKVVEELYDFASAKNKLEKKGAIQRIKTIGKETFLNQKAISAASITALPFIPAKALKTAFVTGSIIETSKFIDKPTVEGAGRLASLYTLYKIPKIYKKLKLSTDRSRAEFQFKDSSFKKINYEKTLVPKRKIIKFKFGGKQEITYTDFGLPENRIQYKLAAIPDSGRPIIVKQQRLFSKESIRLLEGSAALKSNIKQSKITNFVFETQNKITFPIETGEYAGIDYPIGNQKRLIKFKDFSKLGTDKIKFPTKINKEFQQSLGLYTGKIIPLRYEAVWYTKNELAAFKTKPFKFPKIEKAKPTTKSKSIQLGKGLKAKQKVIIDSKKDIFAGDVKLKGNLGGVSTDPIQKPKVNVEKIYFSPSSFFNFNFKNKQSRYFENFNTNFQFSKPDQKLTEKLKIDNIEQPDIKIKELSTPKQNFNFETDIDTAQGSDIDSFLIQDIDLDIPDILEPSIPDIPKPKKPKKPDDAKLPIIPKFDLNFGNAKTKKTDGYNALVKIKNRFSKINKNPLPKNKAFNKMSEVVDNTRATVGKIKKSKRKTDKRDTFYRRTEYKFKKINNKYIEKKQYRKDTIQEKGLKPTGFLKNNKKNWF